MAAYFDVAMPQPEKKQTKTGTVVRVVQVLHQSFASWNMTRFHGIIQIDGRDVLVRSEGTREVADLCIARPGDTIEITASSFDDDVVHLQSAKLLWTQEDPKFRKLHRSGELRCFGTVLRKGTYVTSEHGYQKTHCRIACAVETDRVKGVVTVQTDDITDVFVAEPGDMLGLQLGCDTTGFWLKGAMFAKRWVDPKLDY